jgi:FAD/FMN-containing dehydrogenase
LVLPRSIILKIGCLGSEGTLGIITRATVQCHVEPRERSCARLTLASFGECLEVTHRARQHPSLAVCEVWDEACQSLGAIQGHDHHNSNSFHMLLEMHAPLETLAAVLGPRDGVIAQDEQQRARMMREREDIPVRAASLPGHACLKYDLSLPAPHYYQLVMECRQRLQDEFRDECIVLGYGHVADLNLHLNVLCSTALVAKVERCLVPWVYEWTVAHQGSISAEHGIGLLKKAYLNLAKSATSIDLMRRIKAAFDPKNILNPGKIF